jgi:hypothetical protein
MPSIFKYFVSVSIWVLFFFGLAAIVAGFARAFGHSELRMVSAYFGFGILSMFLSIVSVKIRQTLS